MFAQSAKARTFLRASVATLLAGLGAAGAIWVDNDIVKIATAMLIVLGGYLGVGAASGAVEPFFVRKPDDVVVPGNAVSGSSGETTIRPS
jgi:hypothetical protein